MKDDVMKRSTVLQSRDSCRKTHDRQTYVIWFTRNAKVCKNKVCIKAEALERLAPSLFTAETERGKSALRHLLH